MDSCVKPTSTLKGERRSLQVGPHGLGPQLLPSMLLLLRLTEGCNFRSRNRDSRASSSHRREKHSWDWMSHIAGAGMDDTPCTHTDTHGDGADPSGPWTGQRELYQPWGRCPEPLRGPRSKEIQEGKIVSIPRADESYQNMERQLSNAKKRQIRREGRITRRGSSDIWIYRRRRHTRWCPHNHSALAITPWLHPATGTTPAKTALSFVQLHYF